MAEYHYSVQIVSRADGRAVVEMAAYRAGQVLHDQQSGEAFDYRRKGNVLAGGLEMPPGAPAWGLDRELLWQAVEAAEKRKDAQLASEVVVAIPYGLDKKQAIELIRDYSCWLAERDFTAVDWNIHRDNKKTYEGKIKLEVGYHAHLMRPLRRLSSEGFGEKIVSQKIFKGKSAVVEAKRRLQEEREMWARMANRHLQLAGSLKDIDHRSYSERGLDLEPTIHVGVAVTGMERRGVKTEAGDANREIKARNRKRREINRDARSAVGGVEIAAPRPGINRQKFKVRLLEEHYQAQISEILGSLLAYVDIGSRVSRISLNDGGRLFDHGSLISAKRGSESEIKAVIEIASAKSWPGMVFHGSDAFVRDAALEAMRSGRFQPAEVSARDAHQAQLIDEARQIYAEELAVREAGAKPPLQRPIIPTKLPTPGWQQWSDTLLRMLDATMADFKKIRTPEEEQASDNIESAYRNRWK